MEHVLSKKDKAPRAKAPVPIELLMVVTDMARPFMALGHGADTRFRAMRDIVLLNFMFFGLLRRSDAVELTIGDVDWIAGQPPYVTAFIK
jgi:integrase